MKPSGRIISFLPPCLLAGSFLLLANCSSTISSRHQGKIAEGTWVSALPSGSEKITVEGFTYYVYNGNYYIKRNSRFAVVDSPLSSLSEKSRITSRFQGDVPVRAPHPGRKF